MEVIIITHCQKIYLIQGGVGATTSHRNVKLQECPGCHAVIPCLCIPFLPCSMSCIYSILRKALTESYSYI